MHEHWIREDVVAEYTSFEFLFEPERAILQEIRSRLAGMRMLDIGVGGGRTTQFFIEHVGEYVGVDYSPTMIQACSRRFEGQGDHVSFHVMDARDLGALQSESFDFVLFSFNGLDLVGEDQDRLRALEEIHRVCRDGGLFCFSSQNMDFVRGAFSVRHSVRRILQSKVVRDRPDELLFASQRTAPDSYVLHPAATADLAAQAVRVQRRSRLRAGWSRGDRSSNSRPHGPSVALLPVRADSFGPCVGFDPIGTGLRIRQPWSFWKWRAGRSNPLCIAACGSSHCRAGAT